MRVSRGWLLGQLAVLLELFGWFLERPGRRMRRLAKRVEKRAINEQRT